MTAACEFDDDNDVAMPDIIMTDVADTVDRVELDVCVGLLLVELASFVVP